MLPQFKERDWTQAGDGFALTEVRWNHETARIESTWTLITAGTTTCQTASITLHTTQRW